MSQNKHRPSSPNRSAEKTALVVLEEVMRRAMEEALALREKPLNDEEHGALMAYFNILDWGKQQSEIIGLEFDDRELQAFDPYSLLTKKAA